MFLVELLHHHRNDDGSDVAPDLLESDHAAANFVGTDFHHVNLADDLEDADSGSVAEFGECPCRGRFGGVEEYAALRWITCFSLWCDDDGGGTHLVSRRRRRRRLTTTSHTHAT